MAIDEILEEFENLVVEARRVPFTNKCIIEDDDIVRLIDNLKTVLPQEIQDASNLMQERQVILTEAKNEANKIIEQAKTYAMKLVAENEIVKQAQIDANDIMAKTIDNANALKGDSLNYADEVFDHLVRNVTSTLEIVKQAKADLREEKK